jgi:hypothetical protein
MSDLYGGYGQGGSDRSTVWHVFGDMCLDKWIWDEKGRSCPMCRDEWDRITHEFPFFVKIREAWLHELLKGMPRKF